MAEAEAQRRRSIGFTDLLEAMEDLRRVSKGETTDALISRRFRHAAHAAHTHSPQLSNLIRRFLDTEIFGRATAEAHLLAKIVFDACDRAASGGAARGAVSASAAAMIVHAAVHSISYRAARRYIERRPKKLDAVEACESSNKSP